MNRLILAVLVVVFLIALLLWRRSSRKPAESADALPLPGLEGASPAVEWTAPAEEEAVEEVKGEAQALETTVELQSEAIAEPEEAPVEEAAPVETIPAEVVLVEAMAEEPEAELAQDETESAAREEDGVISLEIEEPAAEPLTEPASVEESPAGDLDIEVITEPGAEGIPVAAEAVEVPIEPEEEVAEPESPTVEAPAFPVEAVAGESAPAGISLSLETYRARLNELEERQRAVLARAMQQGDDQERDRLQRELVIMNDRLALVEDSHADELTCLGEVLATLAQLRGGADEGDVAAVMNRLCEGETQPAEEYLARLSEGVHPLAAQAAYGGGRLAACRVDLRRALALFRRALELEPENLQFLQAAGKTARNLYNYREAVSWQESHVRLSGACGDADPLAKALAQRDLAYTYVLSGQHEKAGPLYKESMTMLARQLGQDHPEMAVCWQQIGELQETLGEYDKAVSLYTKALNILETKRGPEHPALAAILDKLAALCMELEMEKQAVPLYERLVRIREQVLRPTHPQLVKSLGDLAESYRLQGRYAEAEACYLKSLAINETVHGTDHPGVAAVLQELAKLCGSQRKMEEAEQYQQRAAAIFRKSVEAAERKDGGQALTLEL